MQLAISRDKRRTREINEILQNRKEKTDFDWRERLMQSFRENDRWAEP